MYMLFWGEGRIKREDFHIHFLHWDSGEKANLWCSWFQHNHSGFWVEKIEEHLLPWFEILHGAKPLLRHQYQEESWAQVRLEGKRCQGWRNLECGKGEKWRQTMPWRGMGEQQEMPFTRAALSARETSSRLVSALIYSLERGGAEPDKAASQHGSGCPGTAAFPAGLGCPGSAWVAGLSQHGSDWFEGVLFLPQEETAAAARANQPPFPIQITSYPVLASWKHDFVCLGAATLKCNSQSTGKLICENFRRSTSSHGLMANTDHAQYKHTELYCLHALRAW